MPFGILVHKQFFVVVSFSLLANDINFLHNFCKLVVAKGYYFAHKEWKNIISIIIIINAAMAAHVVFKSVNKSLWPEIYN